MHAVSLKEEQKGPKGHQVEPTLRIKTRDSFGMIGSTAQNHKSQLPTEPKKDSWIWRTGPMGRSKMTEKEVDEWFQKGVPHLSILMECMIIT